MIVLQHQGAGRWHDNVRFETEQQARRYLAEHPPAKVPVRLVRRTVVEHVL